MARPVAADQSGAIDGEQHRQVLQGHVVHHLVKSALQESRVNCDHRLESVAGHTCGDRDAMLFGNGDIKIAIREQLFKTLHLRAFAHRGCDANQTFIEVGHVNQPPTKHLGIGRGRLGLACHDALLRVEWG